MAQHDYNIANQTAPSARTDINNALAAIVSNNSGTSAPATVFANQWWYDTTNNILYFRNEGNTAWIEIGELNQVNNKFFSSGTPSGAVMTFAQSSAPTGWLKANGATISRTTYASLFSAIGTTYGAGNGTTTFGLPDLRGEFIRGWDDSRGIDSGRSLGSAQGEALKSHKHINGNTTNSGGADLYGNASGYNTADSIGQTTTNGTISAYTETVGGTETRPRNIALLYCIKI